MKNFMLKVFGLAVEYVVLLPLIVPHAVVCLVSTIGKYNPVRDMLFDAYIIRVCTLLYRFECWRRDLYDCEGIWYAAMNWACYWLAETVVDTAFDLKYEAGRYDPEKIA